MAENKDKKSKGMKTRMLDLEKRVKDLENKKQGEK